MQSRKKVELRLASLDDIDEIIDMARKFHFASPFSFDSFEEGKVKDLISAVANRPIDTGVILFVLQDGQTVGMLAALAEPLLWSNSKQASELMMWVNEDARNIRVANELIKGYEYWAKEVAHCTISTLACFDDKLDKYYKRLGYASTEHAYMKVL